MVKKIKIAVALIISYTIVIKLIPFSHPAYLLVAVMNNKLGNKVLSQIVSYFSVRSYADEVYEKNIYYKGEKIRVRTNIGKLSKQDKKIIYLLHKAMQKRRSGKY